MHVLCPLWSLPTHEGHVGQMLSDSQDTPAAFVSSKQETFLRLHV